MTAQSSTAKRRVGNGTARSQQRAPGVVGAGAVAEALPADPEQSPNVQAARAGDASAPRTTRAETPAARSLLGKLDSLRQQSGNLVGELYARTAGSLLRQLETIEDRAAQRRFRQQGKPASGSPSMTFGGAPAADAPPVNPKTSV